MTGGAYGDTGEPRQGNDVEQGGLDVAAPVIG